MSVAFTKPSLVLSPGQSTSLSQISAVSASPSNPAYLILNGYDRNEYTAGESGMTGSFIGNGRTLHFSAIGGDARGAGIVFTYVPASGRYNNLTYGFLDQLSYAASTSKAEITDLSLFGTNSLSIANNYAANAILLAQYDAAGYIDTLTVATEPNFTGTVPAQATPLSIAAMAQTFVGSVWNSEGCWVLASTISAEAGASLPVQSAVNMAGAANREWIVAFNGPAGATGDWQSMVRAGDMVGFLTTSGTGHITTVVSGSGASALVVDNTTFKTTSGAIFNPANDGSPKDIVIQAAHAASREFAGVAAKSVVIFRLDTPVVSTQAATLVCLAGSVVNLASIFSASDPAGKALTSFQAYTASAGDHLTVGGNIRSATSAAAAVTASSLSQIDFNRGLTVPDMLTVRAFNGAYWGDWTTITVAGDEAIGNATIASSTVSVFRFFDTEDGTHFFTANATERDALIASRSDLAYEGVGLSGYNMVGASPSSRAVFRFFGVADGTHFYTASTSERDALIATRSAEMVFEGTAFYENTHPQAGDMAVHRFFDTNHGTHLFTASASEKASILATRPDLVLEGIAFYAPS